VSQGTPIHSTGSRPAAAPGRPSPTTAGVATRSGVAVLIAQGISGLVVLALPSDVPASTVRGLDVALVALASGALIGLGTYARTRGGAWAILGFLGIAVIGGAGCAPYHGAAYVELAERSKGAEEITPDTCSAHVLAAAAMRDGPDRALRGVGKAAEIRAGAAVHERQAMFCRRLVVLDALGELTPETEADVLSDWEMIWTEGERLVGGGRP